MFLYNINKKLTLWDTSTKFQRCSTFSYDIFLTAYVHIIQIYSVISKDKKVITRTQKYSYTVIHQNMNFPKYPLSASASLFGGTEALKPCYQIAINSFTHQSLHQTFESWKVGEKGEFQGPMCSGNYSGGSILLLFYCLLFY